MQVLNSIKQNGAIVGYRLNFFDDPNAEAKLDVCSDAMFTAVIVNGLMQAGYKFYNHNADEIVDHKGNVISGLPAIDYEERDNDSWVSSLTKAHTDMLSDYDMAKFYSYRETTSIEFRTESSYEINTRAELIAYLIGMNKGFGNDYWSYDNRPINAITNPDALFTLDEVLNDSSVKKYLNLISKRHRFRDYHSYEKLVKWLCEKGVLATTTPTHAEFLNAYLAWGPDGIKATCTNIETKLNVDGQFSFVNDPIFDMNPDDRSTVASYMASNRREVFAIIDNNLVASDLHKKYDFAPLASALDDLRAPLAVVNDERLMQLKHTDFKGYKYTYVPRVLESIVTDRVYIEMLASDGHTYIYKTDVNNIAIQLKQIRTQEAVYRVMQNFMLSTVVPGTAIPLEYVTSKIDYYIWNAAYLKSIDVWNQKTVDTPFQSSAAMLLSEGINPIAIIGHMAKWIKDNKGKTKFADTYAFENANKDHTYVISALLNPTPKDVLEAYGIDESTLEYGLSTLVDIVDTEDLRERRERMCLDEENPNIIRRGEEGYDPTFVVPTSRDARDQANLAELQRILSAQNDPESDSWDALDYITVLRVAFDTLDNTIQIGNFAEGYYKDRELKLNDVVKAIVTVVMSELQGSSSFDQVNQILDTMTERNVFNMDGLFRKREDGYKGYLIDLALNREKRAGESCVYWTYVNKVFNEISMKPIDERRPYMMEMITLNIDIPEHKIIRDAFTECVVAAIENSDIDDEPFSVDPKRVGYDWSYKKCALKMASWFAAKVAFMTMIRVRSGKINLEPDGSFRTPLTIFPDFESITVEIPDFVITYLQGYDLEYSKKYLTVYDYCRYEYISAFDLTMFFCVNAVIDPWYVKPVHGYKIGFYDLLTNYYSAETLCNASGDASFYDNNAGTGIIVSPISEEEVTKWIPWCGSEDDWMEWKEDLKIVSEATSTADLDTFLNWDIGEPIFAYIKRWMLEKKRAHDAGQMLVSIPLKQDIVYSDIAHYFCENQPDVIAVFGDEQDDRAVNSRCDINVIKGSNFVENAGILVSSQYYASPLALDDIVGNSDSFLSEITGSWEPSMKSAVYENYILIGSDKYRISSLTSQQLDQFASSGILIKLGERKYYVKAVNGDYVLTSQGD